MKTIKTLSLKVFHVFTNHKHSITLTVIICFIISQSCQQKDSIKFESFPNTFNLNGSKVELDQNFKTGLIEIYDSLLLFHSTPENEHCIHLFNKNSFKFIKSIGKKGNGPGEITTMGLGSVDKRNGILYYRDFGKKIMWELNISKMVDNPDFTLTENFPLPKDEFFITFFPEEKEIFSFANSDQNTLISFFDKKSKLIDSLTILNNINVYQKLDEQTRMLTSTYLYQSSPNRKRIAIAYRMADVLTIVDFSGKILSRTNGPNRILEKPVYGKYDYKETNKQIVVSNDHIYCLYLGVDKLFMKNGKTVVNYPSKINIYDWNGNPKAQLNLDYTVANFDIDFENNRIITFSPETGGFIYYHLPKFES